MVLEKLLIVKPVRKSVHMTESLSVDDLHSLTDDGVKKAVFDTVLSMMKSSKSVGDTFFRGYSDPAISHPPSGIDYDLIDDAACSLVCSAISRIPAYEFNKTINQNKADGLWRSKLDSGSAENLGIILYWWAFPDHCSNDKHKLCDYVNDDKDGWGQKYSDYITRKEFLNDLMLHSGEPNWSWKILIMFRKLWFLDAGKYSDLFDALTDTYPDIINVLTDQHFDNFISSDRFSDTMFIDEAARAINVHRESTNIIGVGRGSRVTRYQIWGERVEKFITDKPSRIGIATGNNPKNTKVDIVG
jgi:hypothetical protein